MTTKTLGSSAALTDMLAALAQTIDARADIPSEHSYTSQLLAKGPLHCGKKIAEEGAELALALAAQGETESAAEAADLLYHILVGLRARGVSLDAVADALQARQDVSGLDEKASRTE